MEPSILYQEKDFLVINKPAGWLTHPTHKPKAINQKLKTADQEQKDEPILTDWLLEHYPEAKDVGDDPEIRPGIVHRLDKDTSGVMIVARDQKAFEFFKKSFQEKQIKKTYLALTRGLVKPSTGRIEKSIGLKGGTVKRTVHLKNAKLIKEAVTEYKVKKYFKDFTLVEAEPLTGRTHQIRVHFASIGHPVAGDNLYEKSPDQKLKTLGLTRQFLHAESIEFSTPRGSRLKITADLPGDLKMLLEKLH